MITAGVVGLGDMGSGIARNLMASGIRTVGFDLSKTRMKAFADMGGIVARCVGDLGREVDTAFIMVMTGEQVREVILGEDGLARHMGAGKSVIVTATIKPAEMREIAADMAGMDLGLIDSPVSGGFPGAQGGTLTLMAAGPDEVIDANLQVLQAISSTIHRVGNVPGDGQTMKSCLQSLIGSIFAATFETAAMAAMAGVNGDTLLNVFASSGAGCGVVNTSLENIIDRRFAQTGSHIATMHKDLTIALELAGMLGVPMNSASTAMQLFHAGKTRYPDGDNWVCTRILEEITGAELHR